MRFKLFRSRRIEFCVGFGRWNRWNDQTDVAMLYKLLVVNLLREYHTFMEDRLITVFTRGLIRDE
jgi:hypothetical protein